MTRAAEIYTQNRMARWAAWVLTAVAAWTAAAAGLPSGLPLGIVLLGVVLGSLTALTALGLVLVYRSARIFNFAQADIGGLAVAIAVIMVTGSHLPYFLALLLGLAAAVGTGWVIDAVVIRRFDKAPRLILTVATIGIAQILGAGELGLPTIFSHLSPISTFRTPFRFHFTEGPVVFNGDHLNAVIAVPLVLFGLWWFVGRTDLGIAIRGAADSQERALLLGIPVRKLSSVTWMVAAGLSGLGALLAAPVLGPNLGVVAGPTSLLAPLAAAVIARMESLPATVVASIAIGVFEQAVYWSYPRSSTVDVALFVVVLGALLFQRRRRVRGDDQGLGGYIAIREVRSIPDSLRRLGVVRYGRAGAMVCLSALVAFVPLALSDARLILLSNMAIYGILAVSLVVLAGWAGQISLGQFAFAGVGAAATGSLLVHAHADLFLSLTAAMAFGAVAAVAVGLPALRIPGLFLAVATMAFAVPVSSWLLNSAYFPLLTPSLVPRPRLFGRLDLASSLAFYEMCLVLLVVAMLLARNFRRSRIGRAVVAVRDNERSAAAYAVSPSRARLTAFALSGALAGLAGGLLVIGQRGIGFSGYNPENSIEVFTMVVVGGLGSIPGALLGAVYVQGALYFLTGGAQLLATGAGLLVLLMVVPGGLGEIVFMLRDRFFRSLARRRSIEVPSLMGREAYGAETGGADEGNGRYHLDGRAPLPARLDEDTVGLNVPPDFPGDGNGVRRTDVGVPILSCTGIDASYGLLQVLFGVDLDVAPGEILALLGTNGAGKSTLLKVVSGLLPTGQGTVALDGTDIGRWDATARVRAGMAMMPGGRGVFASLTVEENLRLAGWTRRTEAQAALLFEHDRKRVLELFPALGQRLGTRAGDLSGGEQQMLSLAQVFMLRPRLLLVDELSLGLAPAVVADLMEVVRQIAESGTTVVIVEQSLNVAAALAERAVFMERGQARFSGPIDELVRRPDLARAVFLRSAVDDAVGRGAGAAAASRLGDARSKSLRTGSPSRWGEAAPGKGGTVGGASWSTRGVSRQPSRRHASDKALDYESEPRGTGLFPPARNGDGEPAALQIKGIDVAFGGVRALDGVELTVRPGEVLGIIGANGAGKTTLMDVCSGFVVTSGGRIYLSGNDVTALLPSRRSELGLGRVFQDARLFPSLTVAETLAVALDRHVGVREPLAGILGLGASLDSEMAVTEQVATLLGSMGLERYRDSFISELSTGTRRIVELAAVLAHRPRVLLLDEPSSGIAQREGEALAALLAEVRALTGATIVVIEHDIPIVVSLADRLVCMHLGRVIAEGKPADVLDDREVVASYLGTDRASIARSG